MRLPARAIGDRPQSTDTVVPKRPCSLRAKAWAFSVGIRHNFLTGLPRRPIGMVRRS